MLRILSLLFLVSAALAQTPDRAPASDEWGYRPLDGSMVSLTPPSLSWVHEPESASYALEWSRSADFKDVATVKNLPWSVYTHNQPLSAGTYYWRYRIIGRNGEPSPWSRVRRFTVPADAVVLPQPSMDELRRRIPSQHPRVFVTHGDLARLRTWAEGGGQQAFQKLLRRADELLIGEPTAEPSVRASASDPATNQFWWSNRLQAIRAAQEAEVLSFVYLLTGNEKYKAATRRLILGLASWDPDGPTNWKVNCEAAKPMLHRLARVYDWGYATLSDEERRRVQAVLLRRAMDAWNSGEVRQGAGHLNQPYNSHGNRTWHKLAENALATFGETPDSEKFLHYAVSKFFAAYPVWADDDGGWHEGLNYWAGYMAKATWWLSLAKTTLGIDGFKKPFFTHFADYALYTAPPGSPNMGLGDLAYRPPSPSWSFLYYVIRETRQPSWAWWAGQWKIQTEPDEPVLAFLWGAAPPVEPRTPADLPSSKVFSGIGVAILNSTLIDAATNVQVRFKSSPFGSRSHGLDPQNSFTFTAYGEPLLVNNTYRDLYGSPFHKGWCWTTKAHNAVLVNGEGQKPRSPDPAGRIVSSSFQDGLDHVVGDGTASYEGRLRRALRHVLFIKPDLAIIVDDLEAPRPSTFQWMLHGLNPFKIDDQAARLERNNAGVLVDYVSSQPLSLRQWTGYDPPPDARYLASINHPGIPEQWHLEAATSSPAERSFTLTVLRPFRRDQPPASKIKVEQNDTAVLLQVHGDSETTVALRKPGAAKAVIGSLSFNDFALVRKAAREWRVKAE
jgi:Domain of unknown function (DUF4962)/Heparinase II/III-like protein